MAGWTKSGEKEVDCISFLLPLYGCSDFFGHRSKKEYY